MRSSRLLAFASLAAFAVAISPIKNEATIVPGKFIVEFEDTQGSVAPSDFYGNLTESGLDATHQIELSHTLFSGVSFKLHDEENLDGSVEKIASMRIVRNIWPVRVYSLPVVDSSSSSTLNSVMQLGIQARQGQVPDSYAPHVMGGVDKLHAQGFTGKGIFVAIVDTGVDYNHPALGGGFGAGFKIAHGYDFVGDDYNGFNTPVPDNDPYSSCQPHGTHVSGIVGANPNPWNFTGVVPDATLGVYRVAGCSGGPGTDVIIAAFLKAQEDGADLISASLGGGAGWKEDPLSVAVSRIVAHGTPCAVAAGNDGTEGAFYTSEPGIGIDVLCVGSVDSITSPGSNQSLATFVATGAANRTEISGEFFYIPGLLGQDGVQKSFPLGVLPLWTLLNKSSTPIDPCAPFPEGTPDLSGKLVLMRSTPACFFEELATHAADFGAKYILFYRDVETMSGSFAGNASVEAIGVVSVEQATTWMSLLKEEYDINVNFTGAIGFFTYENEVTGGYMSTYSDWSPTFEMSMKPQVSAPGRNILSTYPLIYGGYAVDSGTSMATPYMAGVIALVKQVRGKSLEPQTINSIIGNSAKPRHFNDGGPTQYPYLAPAFQQGGGLVDAYAAAHITTLLSKSSILLNDTAHFNDRGRFVIQNTGTQAVTYSLAHQPAGTFYTLPSGAVKPSLEPPDFAASYATLEITPLTITIPAGGSADIAVKFTLPVGLDATRLPVYSGYIAVNGTNGDTLTLPYGGLAADLKTAGIIDTQEGFPFMAGSVDGSLQALAADTVFTLPKSNGSSPANETTYPEVVLVLAMGSAYITADLIPVAENFTCTTETGRTSLAILDGMPQYYMPRDNYLFGQYTGNGTEADSVPPGNYTILVRALRIFGNKSLEGDFDVACTKSFVIEYA